VRLPTYAELRRFVEVEGWTDKDAQAGKKKGDHHRYVFTTPSGERLFTRISHGRGQYQDPDLFQHILRDQLQIDEAAFWLAVDQGVVPNRPLPGNSSVGADAIDGKLARNLIVKVGLEPGALVGMTQEQAVARWQEWLTAGR